ncbi:MAG: hypothetical protein IJ041_05450 [Clostridia bacterium]|nr:hypothetical protein [Clostridia bacterium]
MKKAAGITAIILVLVIILYTNGFILLGNNQKAFKIAVSCAGEFQDPASLRLLGGTLSVDKNSMWCKTSANNRYGNRTTSYYFFNGPGGWVSSADHYTWCTAQDEFNVDLVNKALARYLKRYD